MKKRTIRIVATILLITLVFQMLFPSFVLAESSINPDTDNPLQTLEKNPTYNPSYDTSDGITKKDPKRDADGNEITDGERNNDDINYPRNEITDDIRTGAAPKRESDKGKSMLSMGANLLAFVISIVGTLLARLPAGILVLLTAVYWEEPPKDIENEQYKDIRTPFFTLENLFFNRVRILDANIFKASDKPDGTNQSIKDNVAIWTHTIRQLALVVILFIMLYLAIMLIISTIQGKPAARANYKSFFIDIFISIFLAFVTPIFVAVVMYTADIVTEIIWGVAKALLEKDTLNFEKVIIYSFLDFKMYFTNPLKKAINIFSFTLLIYLHVKFLWIFTRRLLTISFLTIISPLISITYAVDKFKDGKTQVFSAWATEIINLAFLMPLYAGMYTVFAIAMGGLAEQAPMLGLVFLLFFGKIEKVIKEAFNMRGITGVQSTADYSLDAGSNKSRIEKKQKEEKKKKEEE